MIGTLVVDDDFRVCGIHAAYVSRVDGFEVLRQASSTAQALAAVHELHPDLILLDLYLPDGNGLDVLRRLTEEAGWARPDAIVITAARDVASVRAAMKLGAVGYLVKPFGFRELAERLNAYKSLRRRIAAAGPEADTDQAGVDALFSAVHPTGLPLVLPKGLSSPTLALVRAALGKTDHDASAADIAEATGVSRATAQRYLTYLVQQGAARLELRYGSTGRPEHRYRTA
ncbi:two-component system response regulator [Streptacidiphilus pinicola]|uniref:Transcriptional regulatory protein n=1 Tax=Streptacidiphilus pinicola TaxID=2219663 RepID=A0A2X0IMU3_9ACTN|nr:response regulator [Streptacidiphilus pinicola]RAG86464.1 two-component system response regulator [Streptacidiphilus pinicola]